MSVPTPSQRARDLKAALRERSRRAAQSPVAERGLPGQRVTRAGRPAAAVGADLATRVAELERRLDVLEGRR